MSAKEISSFLASVDGKRAGLSRSEAAEQGISSGRDSARAIIRMKGKASGVEQALQKWSTEDWKWAGKQVSFISRMKGNPGPLFETVTVDGRKVERRTRKLLSLLVWGHDPRKVRKMAEHDIAVHKAGLPLRKGESVKEYTEALRAAVSEEVKRKLSLTNDSKCDIYCVEVYASSVICEVYRFGANIDRSKRMRFYAMSYTRSPEGAFSFSSMTEVERKTDFVPKAQEIPTFKSHWSELWAKTL